MDEQLEKLQLEIKSCLETISRQTREIVILQAKIKNAEQYYEQLLEKILDKV